MNRCSVCGHENLATHSVCQNCGSRLPSPAPAGPPSPADPDRMVLVRSYASEALALAASQALEASGVLCNVFPDDCGGMLPPLQQGKGFRVFVAARDTDTAREILAELDETEASPPPLC